MRASLPELSAANASAYFRRHAAVLVLYASAFCSHSQQLVPELTRTQLQLPENGGVSIALSTDAALAADVGLSTLPAPLIHRRRTTEHYSRRAAISAVTPPHDMRRPTSCTGVQLLESAHSGYGQLVTVVIQVSGTATRLSAAVLSVV